MKIKHFREPIREPMVIRTLNVHDLNDFNLVKIELSSQLDDDLKVIDISLNRKEVKELIDFLTFQLQKEQNCISEE